MTLLIGAAGVVLAFIYGLLFVSGGPRCAGCGASENQCHESLDVAHRACCQACSHGQHVGS
jgi:hypothetical protein